MNNTSLREASLRDARQRLPSVQVTKDKGAVVYGVTDPTDHLYFFT
jgi:hypothetical protein